MEEKKKRKKAIIFDMDETLVRGITGENNIMMVLRPNIDQLIAKLYEAKQEGIDIILCTTANNLWVERFLNLKPEFKDIFDKIFNYDNENIWRNVNYLKSPVEYGIKTSKPVTAFGYDSILFIDDAPKVKREIKDIYLSEDSFVASELLEHLCNIFPEEADESYKDIDEELYEDEDDYEIDILKKMLKTVSEKKDCIIPSEQIDATYFSGFGFGYDMFLYEIESILGAIKDPNLNPEELKKIKQYIEYLNKEPGCQMMCSVIDTFMQKEFMPGLTLPDQMYRKEFEEYTGQKKKYYGELSALESKCPEGALEEYISTDKLYPYEGLITEKTKAFQIGITEIIKKLIETPGTLDAISTVPIEIEKETGEKGTND